MPLQITAGLQEATGADSLRPLHGTCRWIVWGSGPYASSLQYAKLDMNEGLFTSLPLSEVFGNVDKIGVRNRDLNSKERDFGTCYKKRLRTYLQIATKAI